MTALYRQRYRVSSIRLPRWDYRSAGWYFITICTRHRSTQPFGYIQNGYVCLSDMGTMAHRYWLDIPNHFNNVSLDFFVIMPDHMHGIIRLHRNIDFRYGREYIFRHAFRRDVACNVSTWSDVKNPFSLMSPKYGSLSTIIRSYKSAVTRWGNAHNQLFQWQPRYFEKIIRSQQELLCTAVYFE